jgi:type VI secretion system secreted protein Hcp
MAIFVLYPTAKGEASAEGFKDYFEVHSLQWGVGRGISSGVGGASKREATAPSVSEITVTKTFDTASPLLLKESLGGKAQVVKISLTQTDNDGKHVAFQKYVLTDCLISGYSFSSGGDRPSESLSLNFTKVDSEYLKIDDKFASTTTGHVVWDIAKSALS